MRLLLALVLLGAVLAGCVEDKPEAAPDEAPKTEGGGKGGLGYDIDPETANETMLEGAHTHDEWGSTTEMVLFDGTVHTQECGDENFLATAFFAMTGLFFEQSVQVGCAQFRLGEGSIVHEGTARLRVEVDATDALKQGAMQLSYRNAEVDFQQMPASNGAVFTWEIEMTPLEWDLPHSTQTDWWFFLQPDGTVAILDGEIKVFIAAERVEDWTPILGSAHIDHWAPDAAHDFVEEDVMRILDENVTVETTSFGDRLTGGGGGGGFNNVPFEDIVAPGTKQVTIAVQWSDVSGCPPQHVCWIVPLLSTSDSGRGFLEAAETGDGYAVFVLDVPDPVAPDSTYANESSYSMSAFVRSCIPGAEDIENPFGGFRPCFGEFVASMKSDVWFYAEAWENGARLDEFKTRVGLL